MGEQIELPHLPFFLLSRRHHHHHHHDHDHMLLTNQYNSTSCLYSKVVSDAVVCCIVAYNCGWQSNR
ncbi:hypothetical protein E2C01_025042 [Portunus trituberculatus]|uniref:Uncharacterized protein n=1 Tax=Portunus trituberculatus TaxID=210409 RepID=A0A5B7EED0_PORTR|nr:hypothetical protein [Portunus trituberculatus]